MQVIFDTQTMLFMDVVTGACLSIAIGFSARDRIVCPGLWFWLASLTSSTAGLFSMLLRPVIAEVISVALANGLLLLGYTLLWLGFRQYTKALTQNDKYIVIFPVLMAGVQSWLTLVDQNSLALRSQLFSYAMIFLIALTIHQTLKDRKKVETGRLLCVCALLFTISSTVIRVITLQQASGHPGLFANSMSGMILMASSGVSLVWTATSIMLISSQWLQQRLYVHATYDALTGIYNRYALIELGETIEVTKNLSSQSWSLAMIDIDHFKCVNDQYGHQVGDIVLREVARMIKSTARYNDIVSRYGGEEFVVVLTDCDLEKAIAWGERARLYISSNTISANDLKIPVTVSIGIACSSPEKYRLHDVLQMADSALYLAKQNGRDRVCSNQLSNSNPANFERLDMNIN